MKALKWNSTWAMGLVGWLLVGLVLSASAQYEVPATINYQGKLVDPTSGPLKGVQTVQFRIYDSLTGGTLIWGRQFPVSCTTEGVFNIVLSDGGSPLESAAVTSLADAFQQQTRFLELTVVDHGDAIAPRQQLVSAPYAMQANYAHKAPNAFSSGGNLTVGGSLFVTNGAATVSGEVQAATLSVGGNATIGGNVDMTSSTLSAKTVHATDGHGILPIGGIILWSGSASAIPGGWALCDGSQGTPDLRNRFVIGAGGAYSPNATGGAESVTLTLDQIPSHTHGYTQGQKTSWWGHGAYDDMWYSSTSGTTGSAGGGQAHENRPPYYALCYIMRIQ
ncbi:MAG: hypothetical protein LBN38_07335 [Verrucomicrobiota bacterium]|nr:hypothetical protein [Verrucomicrobiota bacterium]